MRDLDEVFDALAASSFRRRFHLDASEREYLRDRGMPAILEHAMEFVAQRLAPGVIPNDGRQTPYRGHPIFIAQHATACCCRGCLGKVHGIPRGRPLTLEEERHILAVLERWLRDEEARPD